MTTQPETLDAYTVEETAAALNVSRQTVYNWLEAGRLSVVYSGGGTRWLVTGDSIRTAMEVA